VNSEPVNAYEKLHQIRPAATVILTRQHAGELQVYLLKRSAKSGFMAGKYVFPGGAVDPQDRCTDTWINRIDLDAEAIRRRFCGGLSLEEGLAYGVAAIRETLEEAGVFLARKEGMQEGDFARIKALRSRTGEHAAFFKELVISEQWTLAFSSLFRWSHWITPLKMKKRYNTRFLMAVMPSGQVCRPDTWETNHGVWVTPENGLYGNMAGEIPLSPPTLVTLHELLNFRDLRALRDSVENRQWGDALLPRLIPLTAGFVIVEPWDPAWHLEKIAIDEGTLKKKVLSVGEPFSRLWNDGSLFRPVGI